MKTIGIILIIGVMTIMIGLFVLGILSAIKNQNKFQEQKENSFWECVENNNELEWCLTHFH